jgi:hypothetical protein
MMFTSALLLLYTAVISPVQLCLWDYNDPCNTFPTLYWDVLVDAFFVVRGPFDRPRATAHFGSLSLDRPRPIALPLCSTRISRRLRSGQRRGLGFTTL